MLLINQITYNDEVKIGVIDTKEADNIANLPAQRKDLQDVLQCSMSRRMPKRSPMLLLLPSMIKITMLQLIVL